MPTSSDSPSNSVQENTSSLRYLKGVGPKRAQALERLGIRNLHDLLYLFPRRYEDRSQYREISSLIPGEPGTVRGEVLSVKLRPIRRRPLLEVTVGDESGAITAVWFNQAYLKNQFKEGMQVILFGKADVYKNRMQMSSPEYEFVEGDEAAVHTGRITPIYPLTEGVFQKSLRITLSEAVQHHLYKVVQDYLPAPFREERGFIGLREAITEMHFPSSFERLEEARKRLVYDEFFLFEVTLLRKMKKYRTIYRSYPLNDMQTRQKAFSSQLPFEPTNSQSRAMGEIGEALSQRYPMNRMLMGDVGSGKTVIAAYGMMAAAQQGYQAAILCPTEILAMQHHKTLAMLLKPFKLEVKLLTASTVPAVKERMLAELKQGKIPLVVGTHALIQESVKFAKLALLVIDEQHKFGVHQRCRLLEQDPRPHQLVMTATPIPRTLALTIYGDLEVSALRELPAGRKPIKTWWITRRKQDEVWRHILEKLQEGDQAYIIFPLVEETEKSDLLAAKEEYEKLSKGAFSSVQMGLVHGRMNAEERESVMRSFREGETQVLVATSVVEVGVDNPNATIMVIENAERFGLSQLHQMRGRIGRGQKESECFLFGEPTTDEGKRRLRILTRTIDGFEIAEEDLKLRGPGDFWGTRQSGDPVFNLANPLFDQALLEDARRTAVDLVKGDQLEQNPEWRGVKNYLEQFPLRY